MKADAVIQSISRWLLTEGRRIQGTGAFDEALVAKLRENGLPVARFTTAVPSLHPQVDSFSTLWEEGKGITFRHFRMTPEVENQLMNSPIIVAYDEGRIVHCPLEGPPEEGEYDILRELRADGYTDYVVIPLPFGDGTNKAVSFATRRTGGFAERDLSILTSIRDTLSATMEIRYLRHMAETLVHTYVGPAAGEKVLAGAIKRGQLERIRAVIWFCDLRGFTELSEHLGGTAMIELLNDYFGSMGQAIAGHGGEILKFIGDAMLAIFALDELGGAGPATDNAYNAAVEAERLLTDANRRRGEQGASLIRYGIALHVGDVLYGNVGAEHRLDFTVIGPAVNLASRIEDLCGRLGQALLASESFVMAHRPDIWVKAGNFELKGVEGVRPVYARAAK